MLTPTETKKLTIRLPQNDLQFIKQFASDNNVTVTELVKRYFSHLREKTEADIDPRLQTITGIFPELSNEKEEYADYLLKKHS